MFQVLCLERCTLPRLPCSAASLNRIPRLHLSTMSKPTPHWCHLDELTWFVSMPASSPMGCFFRVKPRHPTWTRLPGSAASLNRVPRLHLPTISQPTPHWCHRDELIWFVSLPASSPMGGFFRVKPRHPTWTRSCRRFGIAWPDLPSETDFVDLH